MTKPTLPELYASHRGKVSDKWSSYLPNYDRLFRDLRDRPISLLEIGTQNGGALEIWAQYFPNAERIEGIDVNPKCGDLKFTDQRIQVHVADASKTNPFDMIGHYPYEFDLLYELDIIIDDGSHHPQEQLDAFRAWFPVLKDGGIYVIEDMHCDNCVYALNQLEIYAHDLVLDRPAEYPIQRVEYLNSMLVFIKGDGSLGPRVVAGQIEAVAGGHLGMNGTFRHG